MSVLIEIQTIVVRRGSLDESWPGGTDAYLAAAAAPSSPARHPCADDNLTSVSFVSRRDCQTWFDRLESNGIRDAAWIDLICEPSLYDWIDYRLHPDGYAYAWLAGTNPGELAAPEEWKPHVAARPDRNNNRMIHLASDGGLEYWLDLDTGEQVVGMPRRTDAPTPNEKESAPASQATDTSLMSVVRATLEHLEWTPDDLGDGSLSIRANGNTFSFLALIKVDEAARTVVCCGFVPAFAPIERRAAVAEAIVRINYRLQLGSFDLDFDDGEVRYRVGCDVEGGALTEKVVMTMLGNVCASIDRYGPALMQVLLGVAGAEEAARRALDGDQ